MQWSGIMQAKSGSNSSHIKIKIWKIQNYISQDNLRWYSWQTLFNPLHCCLQLQLLDHSALWAGEVINSWSWPMKLTNDERSYLQQLFHILISRRPNRLWVTRRLKKFCTTVHGKYEDWVEDKCHKMQRTGHHSFHQIAANWWKHHWSWSDWQMVYSTRDKKSKYSRRWCTNGWKNIVLNRSTRSEKSRGRQMLSRFHWSHFDKWLFRRNFQRWWWNYSK